MSSRNLGQEASPSKKTGSSSKSGFYRTNSQKVEREANPPSYRDDYQDPTKKNDENSRRYAGGESYLSRFSQYDTNLEEEIGGPEWIRKSSRQRRFTNGTLPQLHVRAENAIAEGRFDEQDQEREQVLFELEGNINDMSNTVNDFVERKEEELAQLAEMFDEEGNPILRYDEDGNPIPFQDEDGYAVNTDEQVPQQKMTVKIDLTLMNIKEGWLWKKGSGVGLLKTTSWKRRYFKFDAAKPVIVYYYKDKPKPIDEKRSWESDRDYRIRRDIALGNEKRKARGMVNLMYASLVIPEVKRNHINKQINGEYEFDIVSSNGSRPYTLFAETKEEFEKWVQSFSFVTNLLHKARAQMQRGSTRTLGSFGGRSTYDELKKETALACTAFGSGLFEAVAGQEAEFFIQAVNKETAAPDQRGGLNFACVLESRELHYDLKVVDLDNGTYQVKYVPTRIGTYELSVLLDDYDVKGSPFHPKVLPAPVSAPHCLADGAGLYCAVVGAINRITIHARNSFNQIIVAKNVQFEVFVAPPLVLCNAKGDKIERGSCVRDNNNGTYSVFYLVELTPELESKLKHDNAHVEGHIEITLDDRIHTPSFSRSIKGGPFRPVLAASATGAALATAAKHASFHLSTRNEFYLLSHMEEEDADPKQRRKKQIAVAGDEEEEEEKQEEEEASGKKNQRGKAANQSGLFSPPLEKNNMSALNVSMSSTPSFLGAGEREEEERLISNGASLTDLWRLDYLPIRRVSPDKTPSNVLTKEQREAIEREREELLRLRRDLEEGRFKMDEQVGKMTMMGRRVLEESEKMRGVKPKEKVESSPMPSILPPRSFDQSVMALVNKHLAQLKRVYRFYCTRVDGVDGVRLNGFVKCASDFDITPTFCSKKELRDCFEASLNNANERVSTRREEIPLDFPGFVDGLCFVAITSLGKPMFAHLYTTNASRVSVLLVMWGLGDANQLDAVVSRERYLAG